MNDVQILLYTDYLYIIGGIETFVLNFIELMSTEYTIGVYCPKLPPEQAERISDIATLYQDNRPISCDTLIMIRMMDVIPPNVTYRKSIRMCHACKSNPSWFIRRDCNEIVHVSQASRASFESDGEVIHNPLIKSDEKALLLVSATRIPAPDKGLNADRMIRLANMLHHAFIPFIWLNFSDAPLPNVPAGLINVGTYQEIQPYIAKADYLVQLSDQEGFGYSVLEALINNTAVICTPFSTTKELGVIDGQNGYIVPFDMDFDVEKLLNVPRFTYRRGNDPIKMAWVKLINRKPKKHDDMVTVEVIRPYRDILLDKELKEGDILKMPKYRAIYVESGGFVEIKGDKV